MVRTALIRRAVATACLTLAVASTAAAQEPLTETPTSPQFMPRYDFHISVAALGSGDDRFAWDGHAGGSFDVVDYVRGRSTITIDYQAVMGKEFRAFDVNQGNYTLAVATSARISSVEFTTAFHHVSRHLSDRPKRIAIAWNDLDFEALGHVGLAGTSIDVRALVGKTVAQSWVDYSWLGNLEIGIHRPVNRHATLYGRLYGEAYGINPSLSDRGTQTGGRVEAGIRLTGSGGALEFFGGYERVVDADPFEQIGRAWAFGGFRVSNK